MAAFEADDLHSQSGSKHIYSLVRSYAGTRFPFNTNSIWLRTVLLVVIILGKRLGVRHGRDKRDISLLAKFLERLDCHLPVRSQAIEVGDVLAEQVVVLGGYFGSLLGQLTLQPLLYIVVEADCPA